MKQHHVQTTSDGVNGSRERLHASFNRENMLDADTLSRDIDMITAELILRNPTITPSCLSGSAQHMLVSLAATHAGARVQLHLYPVRHYLTHMRPLMGVRIGHENFVLYFRGGAIHHTAPRPSWPTGTALAA